ncbi:replicative DNA helicase [Alicyclobacillus fastidiosus]|uniref:Replicative DNA helicase n=1 Tax=Alicyclobacillus fastidiosus TaxID=392011 RepID=A0ABV5AA07_9BACL|nr:replicative DNA helicase [Alicyclobacillus fastidiosus]WEH10955.1 replicative DNA helicase [Alicyclobacillus fastidiosus]
MLNAGLRETESAVVSTVVNYPDTLDEIDITYADFLDPECSLMFRTAAYMREMGEQVNLFVIMKKLQKRMNSGIIAEICDISRAMPSSIKEIAQIVRQAALLRAVADVGKQLVQLANDDSDPTTALDTAEKALAQVTHKLEGDKGPTHVADGLMEHWATIEHRFENRGKVMGVPTGLNDVDKLIGGWQEKDFVIVAARPSMGKTAFMLHAAVATSQQATGVIFSAEMGKEQLFDRLLAAHTTVSLFSLRNGLIEDDQFPDLSTTMSGFSDRSLFIDDTSMVTMSHIRSTLRKLRRRMPESMKLVVYLDYLQLVRQTGRSRNEEVSEISQMCKATAKDLNCTFVALSQLSRKCEERANKRPMLSDLRDSGSIEQDADIVAFLYRDEYYNPETDKQNIMEFIVAKNRNGPTGTAELVFMKQNQRFVNLERRPSDGDS